MCDRLSESEKFRANMWELWWMSVSIEHCWVFQCFSGLSWMEYLSLFVQNEITKTEVERVISPNFKKLHSECMNIGWSGFAVGFQLHCCFQGSLYRYTWEGGTAECSQSSKKVECKQICSLESTSVMCCENMNNKKISRNPPSHPRQCRRCVLFPLCFFSRVESKFVFFDVNKLDLAASAPIHSRHYFSEILFWCFGFHPFHSSFFDFRKIILYFC